MYLIEKMKKIIIVRHAKSTWTEQVNDHERGLKNRGFKDAELVSMKFKELNLVPDKLISSTAKRAKLTAEIFIKNLNISPNKLCFDKNLYDFSGENLVETIKNTEVNIETLMVFGHNHALTNFANDFGDRYIENVSTSGLVVLDFHVDSWNYIFKGNTIHIIFPRDLKS